MLALPLMLCCLAARADEVLLRLEGEVPSDGPDHFFLPFEVPAGVAEVEIRHGGLPLDPDQRLVLDWGLDGPDGFVGWGGGNSEPAVVAADAASRSYRPTALTPGTWQVVVGKATVPAAGATYAVDILLRDSQTLDPQPERQPYRPQESAAGSGRWYAGDLHVHSRESGDATATFDEIAQLAQARDLDFVVLSDHNTVSQDDFIVDAQARWPDLLLVPGIEFTTYAGHAGAFGATAWVDHRIGQPGATLAAAAQAIHDQGGLLVVNHPNLALGDACIGCAWEQDLDPQEIDAIEIITGGWAPVGGLFFDANIALWESWMAAGARVAPVGGSDDHRAGQGTGATDSPIGSPTTLIWADALTVAGLRAGLVAGRTVVKLQGPDDPMLELWPQARPAQGEDPLDDGVFVATVTRGAGARLQWLSDGVVIREDEVTDDIFEATISVDAPPEGLRLRAVLTVDGQPRVLTGAWWVQDAPSADSGGDPPDDAARCGCGGGLAMLLLWPAWGLAAAGMRRRYRPLR